MLEFLVVAINIFCFILEFLEVAKNILFYVRVFEGDEKQIVLCHRLQLSREEKGGFFFMSAPLLLGRNRIF